MAISSYSLPKHVGPPATAITVTHATGKYEVTITMNEDGTFDIEVDGVAVSGSNFTQEQVIALLDYLDKRDHDLELHTLKLVFKPVSAPKMGRMRGTQTMWEWNEISGTPQ